jgi:hypothetical protein
MNGAHFVLLQIFARQGNSNNPLSTIQGSFIKQDEAERAFEKIKIDVSNLQTLFFIDDDAPIFLHTDACKYGP